MQRWKLPAVVGVLVVLLDQWTKHLIVRDLGPASPTQRVALGADWIALEYAENRGVAFGLLARSPLFAAVAALAVAAGLTVYIARQQTTTPMLMLGFGLTVGGAISNLVDRARLGFVVDFVAIGAWPNFNVADSAICGGMVLLALDLVMRPEGDPAATEQLDER